MPRRCARSAAPARWPRHRCGRGGAVGIPPGRPAAPAHGRCQRVPLSGASRAGVQLAGAQFRHGHRANGADRHWRHQGLCGGGVRLAGHGTPDGWGAIAAALVFAFGGFHLPHRQAGVHLWRCHPCHCGGPHRQPGIGVPGGGPGELQPGAGPGGARSSPTAGPGSADHRRLPRRGAGHGGGEP